MTKCQITCKSLQKSSKFQNFLRVLHLSHFQGGPVKKNTLYNLQVSKNNMSRPCVRLVQGASRNLAWHADQRVQILLQLPLSLTRKRQWEFVPCCSRNHRSPSFLTFNRQKNTPGDCLCFTSKQFPARKGQTLYRNPISVNNQVSHIHLMCHIPYTCSPAECADLWTGGTFWTMSSPLRRRSPLESAIK